MKVKILLLPILIGAFTLSLNAQKASVTVKNDTAPCNCGSVKDSILVRLNNNEDVIVERRSSEQLSVSKSSMAKSRKSFDCPDIFAPPAPKEPTPNIETPTPPADVVPEIKTPIKGKPFFLPDPVFFRINKWVIDAPEWAKIELAVSYLNANPGSTVVVTGYADKKTGNTAINLKLSQQRSNAVAAALEKKYGIAKDRITINWKGDGLQPFQLENDKNRAVLFLINP